MKSFAKFELMSTTLFIIFFTPCGARSIKNFIKSGICPPLGPIKLTDSCEIESKDHCTLNSQCPNSMICCQDVCHKMCKFPNSNSPLSLLFSVPLELHSMSTENHKLDFKDVILLPSIPLKPVSRNQRNRNLILQGMETENQNVPTIGIQLLNGSEIGFKMNPGCNNLNLTIDENRNDLMVRRINPQGNCLHVWEDYYCTGNKISNLSHQFKFRSTALCDSEKCTRKGYFGSSMSRNKYFRCIENHMENDGSLLRIDYICPSAHIFQSNISKCIPIATIDET